MRWRGQIRGQLGITTSFEWISSFWRGMTCSWIVSLPIFSSFLYSRTGPDLLSLLPFFLFNFFIFLHWPWFVASPPIFSWFFYIPALALICCHSDLEAVDVLRTIYTSFLSGQKIETLVSNNLTSIVTAFYERCCAQSTQIQERCSMDFVKLKLYQV